MKLEIFQSRFVIKQEFCDICFLLGTFAGLSLEHLVWAAALVLHDLNNHSSRTSLAPGGLKASPFKTGQLARAPRGPNSQMAVSWGQIGAEEKALLIIITQ